MRRLRTHPVFVARLVLLALAFMVLAVTSSETWLQSTAASPGATAQGPRAQSGAAPQTTAPGDDLAQMRTDLNQMEGLLNNMSSEIEFLHDQNLQILLRTNAQMWTILLRDLRKQVAREEQRARQNQPGGKSAAKPKQ